MKRTVNIIDELIQHGCFHEDTIDFIIDTAKDNLTVEIDERDECGELKAVATIAGELSDIFKAATGIYSGDVFTAMLNSEIDTAERNAMKPRLTYIEQYNLNEQLKIDGKNCSN